MATLPQPLTRSGLLPEARHVVLPKGIVASGFPRVRETSRRVGIEFDPWQTDLNRCILAKTSDGLLAADIVVLSVSRQVGKTFDIGAIVFATCIAEPNTTVVWTAHRFKVSRETFNELRALAKSPKLAPHIDYDAITTAAGNECIPFRNGSRIVFAARERGAIRGFTKVKILVLDEGQILTEAALADLVPTMNQAVNPQVIIMGTPPKPTDPGEVFARLRAEALAGESEGVLYVELSADPGSDPDDRKAWAKANPSFPTRTPARAIMRLRKVLSLEDFMREALGIWDSDSAGGVISRLFWDACEDAGSKATESLRFGLDVAPDRSWSAIGVAGRSCSCKPPAAQCEWPVHIETTSRDGLLDHREGTAWVVPRLEALKVNFPDMSVTMVAGGGGKSLVPAIEEAGITVDVIPSEDVAAACGLFYDLALVGGLRHIGQPSLTQAIKDAVQLPVGDKAFTWGRRKSAGDITELYATNLALWACVESPDIAPSAHYL